MKKFWKWQNLDSQNKRLQQDKKMDIELLKQKMDEAHYVYDEHLITTLFVALKLGRPLLIEGAAGLGKT